MSKLLKKRMAQELCGQLSNIDSFILFNCHKMKSRQSYTFRKEMRAKNIKVKILKNTLAKIAFSEIYHVNLEQLLAGTIGMAYGADSPATVAKALQEWNKKEKVLVIKGGYLPNRILNQKEAEGLAKIPAKPVLLSMLAGSFSSLLQQTASLMKAPLQNMSVALRGLAEKNAK